MQYKNLTGQFRHKHTLLLYFVSSIDNLMDRRQAQSFVVSSREQDYCINISEWYCSHWEAVHALREALQNWQDAVRTKYAGKSITIQLYEQPAIGLYTFHPIIDGVKSQPNWIRYDAEEKTLVLSNEGSFKVDNMLMGSSSNKAGNQLALGQFGQGMKLYQLILLMHGLPIFIQSGDYYYGPQLGKWTYEYHSKVLNVHIKKRAKPQDNTVVTIDNVTQELFENFRYLSLSLVKDYAVISYDKKSLIISNNPRLRGKIFKKGILVGMRYNCDSPYSYDLDDIVLGRDRDSINDPHQLWRLQSSLHTEILKNNDELKNTRNDIRNELIVHLEQVVKSLKRNAYNTYFMHETIDAKSADRLYRFFLKQNNAAELYPMHANSQAVTVKEYLSNYGLPSSFYPTFTTSCHYDANLQKSTLYQTIQAKIQKCIKVGRKLNDEERNCLKPITDTIAKALPQINTYEFLITDLEKVACYKEPNKKIFNLNKVEMAGDKEVFKMRLMELLLKDLLK